MPADATAIAASERRSGRSPSTRIAIGTVQSTQEYWRRIALAAVVRVTAEM